MNESCINGLGGRYLTEDELTKYGFKSLGHHVQIHSRASIYCCENISIGNYVRIDDFAVLVGKGGIEIGSHVHIANFCFLGAKAGIVMKDFTTLANGVKLFSSSDDYSGEYMTNPMLPPEFTGGKSGRIVLEKHVIIGAGSVVLPDVVLGEGVAVGALSLVTLPLSPWGIYFGSPVKRIRPRNKKILELEKQFREKDAE